MSASSDAPLSHAPVDVQRDSRVPPVTPVSGRETRLLTITDVAAWLGVSKAWVYDHTTRKRPLLPCIRFGEITRFRREDIERFIEEHTRRSASGTR